MQLPGRPVPTTFEYIEAIALREPQRLALVQDTQSWSYHSLYLDLVRVIRVLHELGVKRGDCVAVGTSGFQAGLLLLLASENLGAVTTAFLHENDPDAAEVFALVDWVFSDFRQKVPKGARYVAVDGAFLKRVEAVDIADSRALPRVALELDDPARISRTSGSSGRSKFMLLKRQAQEYWVRTGAENGGYRPESRLLVAGPLVMNAIFARSSACLRMGAAVMDLSRTGVAAREVTHILALPALLEETLKALPPGFAPRNRIEVQAIGGFVSPQLRERATRAFGGRLSSRYGANETAGICDDLDANGVGVVSAGVDIKVVDESGAELPHGGLGVVAVRTPGMAEEYIGEPAASKAAFRDGWFYSGDWGTLVGARVLRLAGRHDDLVNVGGIKVPAATVEAKVRELASPQDCAVLAVNLDGGATNLGIALVMDMPERDAVRSKIARGLDVGATVGARVLFLDRLPRMANGKIDRVALHALFGSPPPGSV
ncbi:MAG TPA: AMP-binding protein [Ramlibacter sp.]|nr:AMP-binding protein [Ramlibacter sp.]